MIALDGTISSDELNRALFKTNNEDNLLEAIDLIRSSRAKHDLSILGGETVSEQAKNDRILVWMAWASFGWTLIQDKRSAGGLYSIAPNSQRLVSDAAAIRYPHRDFGSEKTYIEHLSRCAGLPEDLR
jgi:hypothetical protein